MRKILVPPLMMLLCILGMVAHDRFGSPTSAVDGAAVNIGYLLIVIGVALPAWSAMIFRRVETNIIPYKSPEKMVTEGPFRFSRNPMYLGMLLVIAGVAIRLGNYESLAFVALFFAVANWWYIPFEETKMRAVFGDSFNAYKQDVRRWL